RPPPAGPKDPFRSLLDARPGLERSASGNPALQHRGRPLRPSSDVAEIRPHLVDVAGDCQAALGSEGHRADHSSWVGSTRQRAERIQRVLVAELLLRKDGAMSGEPKVVVDDVTVRFD